MISFVSSQAITIEIPTWSVQNMSPSREQRTRFCVMDIIIGECSQGSWCAVRAADVQLGQLMWHCQTRLRDFWSSGWKNSKIIQSCLRLISYLPVQTVERHPLRFWLKLSPGQISAGNYTSFRFAAAILVLDYSKGSVLDGKLYYGISWLFDLISP